MNDLIANTIWHQLIASNQIAVMSWGTHNIKKYDKGIVFKVQARRYKGWINIYYDKARDLYDIYFVSGKWYKKATEKPESLKGIFFDQLTEVIDNLIECIPEYDPQKKRMVIHYINN